MSSATNNNMGTMLTLGFKGAGKPNGVPLYNQTGLFTLGGVQSQADSAVMYYGIVVSSDPAGDDGVFTVGAATIAGVASVHTLTITAGCTVSGNINIDGTVIAMDSTAQATVAEVCTAIQAALFTRFTVTKTATTVVFTGKSTTVYSAPTTNFLATGVTGTLAVTTAGTQGSVPRGIVIYRPDIAMLDTAKPSYILQGAPLAVAFWGQIWLASWLKTGAGAIDPVLGCTIWASNTDGNIQFAAAGAGSMTGYSQLANCSVKSVSTDTNGVLLMVNI